MKTRNPEPKPFSKTQIKKAEYLRKHPIEILSCRDCDAASGRVTLRRSLYGQGYLCPSCFARESAQNTVEV